MNNVIEEIHTKEDRVDFHRFLSEYGINNLIGTVPALEGLRLIEKFSRKLIFEVGLELTDGKFSGATHGKRGTYSNLGCHGPLCKHSNKIEARKRNQTYAQLQTGMDDALDALIISHALGMR